VKKEESKTIRYEEVNAMRVTWIALVVGFVVCPAGVPASNASGSKASDSRILDNGTSGSKAPEAKASDSLLNADRALAAQSHAIGFVAAYSKAMAPDARKLDSGARTFIGRDAILAQMAKYPPDLALDWTPEEAVVAESGELGFTWGYYVATFHDSQGKVVTEHGKYLDVWRRQSDGAWRWIADMGNTNPPPA
jgi:ketosteroid isomerase-like protein